MADEIVVPAEEHGLEGRRNADHSRFMGVAHGFWDWIDNRNIDLHLIAGVMMWLTYSSAQWAYDFAHLHPTDGGTVIAAILGPINLMVAAFLNFYASARKNN